MKFKLLFKKGHSNPSSKSTETNQHQQVPVPAASAITTATLTSAGTAASTARSHFENEKSSKQNKNKHQTSVKKVLNSFNPEKSENTCKNLNKVLRSSQERIFPKEQTLPNAEAKENPAKSLTTRSNCESNLKKNVNNSTSGSNRNKFDNVYSDIKNENLVLGKNASKSSAPENHSTDIASDRNEKSAVSKLNVKTCDPTAEVSESRLCTSGHALLAPVNHSLKVMEYQDLKQQLDSVSSEKQMLETKINELLNYQESLKDELCKMKVR